MRRNLWAVVAGVTAALPLTGETSSALDKPAAARPSPTPAARPTPTPVARPTPTPASRPTPTPVARPTPTASTPRPMTNHQELSRFTTQRGFTVTSTTGGGHNPGSAHYQGRAVDVRTRDQSPAQVNQFVRDARAAGIQVRDERTRPAYQAVWSGPHLHLQVPPQTPRPTR